MRIWCCLGFGEGDEKEEEFYKSEKMSESEKERILGNNDMDEGGNVGDGEGNGDGNENVELNPGSLMEGCSSSGAHGDEPSCSWAVPGTESDGIDRGIHFKRPKVRSLALEWDIPFVPVPAQEEFNLYGLIDEEYTEMTNSAGQYVPPVSDGEESEHPADFTSLGVNGDDQVSLDMDFMENGMDLTDDLLHMVFSFLDQINLCKAAKVCRQWRAASTHEDFWRFLNFEDRNISPEQCADKYEVATLNFKASKVAKIMKKPLWKRKLDHYYNIVAMKSQSHHSSTTPQSNQNNEEMSPLDNSYDAYNNYSYITNNNHSISSHNTHSTSSPQNNYHMPTIDHEVFVESTKQGGEMYNLLAMHLTQSNLPPSSPYSLDLPNTISMNQVDYHSACCPCCIFTQKEMISLHESISWIEYLIIRSYPQPNPHYNNHTNTTSHKNHINTTSTSNNPHSTY